MLTNMTSLTATTMFPSYENACRIKSNPLDIAWIRLSLFCLYVAVFTVAVSGNFLVVYVIMNNRKMQTVTNIFICNLAISDLLVNFTSLWLTPMYTYVGHWVWGGWMCYGLPLFQGTSIFISTLTLMAIAVDRYIVIVHNSTNNNANDRMSIKKCVGIVSLIWLFSLLLVMPYAFHMKIVFIDEPCNFWMCTEEWKWKRLKSTYGVIVMILQFVVPFIIIGISYGRIWAFLKAHGRQWQQAARDTARKQRLLRMLVTMVVIFAVCWFPVNMLNILRDLKFFNWINGNFPFIFLVVHLISMTATCWNPILYAGMNETFRKEFMMAIPCLRNTNMARRARTDSVPINKRNNGHQFLCRSRSDSSSSSLAEAKNKIDTVVADEQTGTENDESCHL